MLAPSANWEYSTSGLPRPGPFRRQVGPKLLEVPEENVARKTLWRLTELGGPHLTGGDVASPRWRSRITYRGGSIPA